MSVLLHVLPWVGLVSGLHRHIVPRQFAQQLEDPTQVKDLEKRMLGMLNDAHRSGSDDDLSEELKELVNTSMGSIFEEHNASVILVGNVMHAFAQCNVDLIGLQSGLQTASQVAGGKKTDHEVCRDSEKDAAVEAVQCNDALEALEDARDVTCSGFENLKKNPSAAADVCHSSGAEDYESWLTRNQLYFQTTLATFQQAKAACEAAEKKVNDKKPVCVGFNSTLVSKTAQCDTEQHGFESATCSQAASKFSACDSYSKCYEAAKKEYDDSIPPLETQIESRKAQYRALKRILCLVDTIGQDKQNDAIEDCINKTHDLSDLDIEIDAAPAATACTYQMPIPCSGLFLEHYSALPVEAPAATCVPCTMVTTVSDWIVVLKVQQDSELGYSSHYWEDDQLLNEGTPSTEPGNAKYASYLTSKFKTIRMCVGAPDSNCVEHTFSTEWSSAKALFSAGYIKEPALDRAGILGAFAPTTGHYQDCPMQRPGFNIQCDSDNHARMGFCLNCQAQGCQNDDNDDADASIGIGLKGQSTPNEMGAGWTNYFASGPGTCSANSMTYKNVWLSVKSESQIPIPTTVNQWTLVMKVAADSVLGFSSPLWTNNALLNEDSPIDQAENAKYQAFNEQSFKDIRVCVGASSENCFEYSFQSDWASATELFNAGEIRENLPQDSILSAFAPQEGHYQVCPMQRPGFNIQCNDGNKARMGFCLNCQSQPCQNLDSNDADASIGIGLAGQSTPSEMGAGWTNYFASGPGTCSANSMTYKAAWVWVK